MGQLLVKREITCVFLVWLVLGMPVKIQEKEAWTCPYPASTTGACGTWEAEAWKSYCFTNTAQEFFLLPKTQVV